MPKLKSRPVRPVRPTIPPIGSILAVWWDDPAIDLAPWDPADGAPLQTCPKVTAGVLLRKNRRELVLSHEAWLDGTGRQWVQTIILRCLITRVEAIPEVLIPVKMPRQRG